MVSCAKLYVSVKRLRRTIFNTIDAFILSFFYILAIIVPIWRENLNIIRLISNYFQQDS